VTNVGFWPAGLGPLVLRDLVYACKRIGDLCLVPRTRFSQSADDKTLHTYCFFGHLHANIYVHDNLLRQATDVRSLHNIGENTNLRGTSTSNAAPANHSLQHLLHSRMKKGITTKTIFTLWHFRFRVLFCGALMKLETIGREVNL